MSSIIDTEQEQDPVAKLTLQPTRSILKSSKSIDEARLDHGAYTDSSLGHSSVSGMTRSESKSHKIPRFDEMNIIATYHPADKDYGHMKIEEPKTPFTTGDVIDEEIDMEQNNTETLTSGIDADALADRLNESTPLYAPRLTRRSIDDSLPITTEGLEHRQRFEHHRKQHYNEFEIVRLHRKEIEAELRALEQEDPTVSEAKVKGSPRQSGSPFIVHKAENIQHGIVADKTQV